MMRCASRAALSNSEMQQQLRRNALSLLSG
jgi:hypothetical protein